MNIKMREYITELNQNYNDLGEDLMMLEAVLYASEGEAGFPEEYVESGLRRIQNCIQEHTGDIGQLAGYLSSRPAAERGRP